MEKKHFQEVKAVNKYEYQLEWVVCYSFDL